MPEKSSNNKPLTIKEENFVQELFKGKTQLEAYKTAYNASKMKDKTVYEKACLLAGKDKIRARLKELQDEVKERNIVTVEKVLKEYCKLAFFDPRNLFNENGQPKEITELDSDTAACIAGLDVAENYDFNGEEKEFIGYTKKYKLADKRAALDSIAKHLGMFVDKKEVKLEGSIIKVELTED